MTKYFVVSITPFRNKALIIEAESEEEAIKIAKERRHKHKADVLIAKKEDGNNEFILEKYGYYKVYDFLNKILLGIAIMLILLFSYLYFKYLKR